MWLLFFIPLTGNWGNSWVNYVRQFESVVNANANVSQDNYIGDRYYYISDGGNKIHNSCLIMLVYYLTKDIKMTNDITYYVVVSTFLYWGWFYILLKIIITQLIAVSFLNLYVIFFVQLLGLLVYSGLRCHYIKYWNMWIWGKEEVI